MIGSAAPLSPNSLIAASVSKLLSGLAPPPPAASAKAIAAEMSPLVSSGPLGSIKDPTAASAMSIVQLGYSEGQADKLVPTMQDEASAEALSRTYAQAVEQEYAANGAASLPEQSIGGHTETSAAFMPHISTDIGAAAVPSPTLPPTPPEMGQPLLFIPEAPYMQPASRKSRAKSAKFRASWQFLFGKSEDPEQ